jgi:uroporphyrinogen-III decarboxylase
MPAEDYDALINNPEGCMLRNYLPRVCSQLQGLRLIPSLLTPVEMMGVGITLASLTAPPIQESLTRLGRAIDQISKDLEVATRANAEVVSRYGCPIMMGGITKAPFDIVADTLRGTRAALTDLYRRPEKLLAASDALVPSAIHMGVGSGRPAAPPFVLMPLHKGAAGFMSQKQFEKFYWPTFKRLLEGVIAAGMVPLPFVEGTFDEARLELIAGSGLPAGRTVWLFDRSDLRLVKKCFSGFACIGGNVPVSLFTAGTPAQMEDYCKRLIDDVAPGGGFFLASGAPVDEAFRPSCALWPARNAALIDDSTAQCHRQDPSGPHRARPPANAIRVEFLLDRVPPHVVIGQAASDLLVLTQQQREVAFLKALALCSLCQSSTAFLASAF